MPQPDEAFPTVMVDPKKAFQTIEGIGGALTDAAAETFAKLPKERQREVLEAYFDPANADKDFALWVDGRAAKTKSPAHSVVTLDS